MPVGRGRLELPLSVYLKARRDEGRAGTAILVHPPSDLCEVSVRRGGGVGPNGDRRGIGAEPKLVEQGPQAIGGQGREAIHGRGGEGVRDGRMLRGPQGVVGVCRRLEAPIRVDSKGVEGIERLGVSKHQERVGRGGANGVRRRPAGALTNRGTACLSVDRRFGDGAREEQSLSIGAPLGSLGAVREVGQLIRNAPIERNHEYLRGAADGAHEGEMRAVGMPGGRADIAPASRQQARVIAPTRSRDVQPRAGRGGPGRREMAHRIRHGAATGGQCDVPHLLHSVQVPGLNGLLLARGDLGECGG
jgi:hypothetical protein